MNDYQRILLAADFTNHGEQIATRAKDMADKYQSCLSIIHVVDNLPISDAIYGPVIPFEMNLTEDLMAAAKKRLAELAEQLGVPESE